MPEIITSSYINNQFENQFNVLEFPKWIYEDLSDGDWAEVEENPINLGRGFHYQEPSNGTLIWILWEYDTSGNSSDSHWKFFTPCWWERVTSDDYYKLTTRWMSNGGVPTSNTGASNPAFAEFRLRHAEDYDDYTITEICYAKVERVNVTPAGAVSFTEISPIRFHPVALYWENPY